MTGFFVSEVTIMNIFKHYTKRNLKENKTRTIVTIIGIILSVAMFTATTEAFVTAQNYFVKYAEETSGKYHVGFFDIENKNLAVITEDNRVKSYTYMTEIGYADIGSVNTYKPYLYIAGIPKDFTDTMPIKLIEGRLPENSNEIVIPEHLNSNGGVKLELGQTVTLKVGQREYTELIGISDEEYDRLGGDDWAKLTQQQGLITNDNDEIEEQLINTKERTYTVVGFCSRSDRSSVEPYAAPGYTAYTIDDDSGVGRSNVYTILKNAGKYDDFQQEVLNSIGSFISSCTNNDLLIFSFKKTDSSFAVLSIGFLTILIALIVFGSVSLIYNSFSISVSERTKQFGILKSIGATKSQIKKSVIYEAIILCLVGIPLGLISGCIGIALTFHFLSGTIDTLLSSVGSSMKMEFILSPAALILSSALSLITVIISAYIPAKKAIKINPIEAVRQSNDIKVSRRSVRVSPLTQKLFGFEATISSKNFKRNKKKYRTTVFSLFVSVVLFISASSLAIYFTDILTVESELNDYDILLQTYENTDDDSSSMALFKNVSTLQGIDKMAYSECVFTEYDIESKYVSREYKSMMEKERDKDLTGSTNGDEIIYINFVDDESFKELLKDNKLSEKDYFDKDNPKAILYDMSTYVFQHDNNKTKTYLVSYLDKDNISDGLEVYDIERDTYEGDKLYTYIDEEERDGTTYVIYSPIYDEGDEIDENDKIVLPKSEVATKYTYNIGAVIKDKPYYIDGGTHLIYPQSLRDSISIERMHHRKICIVADDHAKVVQEIFKVVKEMRYDESEATVYDYAANVETMRALVTIAKVLAYGFIVLISMIAAANVFNTISTNISLRRREIATLKSIGLTSKGMRKMMLFESILYGVKSLLFSLPVSLAITYLIYYVVTDSGYDMSFYVPWGTFLTAIISVFIIVALSMVYSMKKVNKENTVETLRNENI